MVSLEFGPRNGSAESSVAFFLLTLGAMCDMCCCFRRASAAAARSARCRARSSSVKLASKTGSDAVVPDFVGRCMLWGWEAGAAVLPKGWPWIYLSRLGEGGQERLNALPQPFSLHDKCTYLPIEAAGATLWTAVPHGCLKRLKSRSENPGAQKSWKDTVFTVLF